MVKAFAIVATTALAGCYTELPPLVDRDLDGYKACGSMGAPLFNCDCDDADETVFPKAEEVKGNCVDEDCDGALAWSDSATELFDPSLSGTPGVMLCATAGDEANPQLGAALASTDGAVDSSGDVDALLLIGAPKRDRSGVVYFVSGQDLTSNAGSMLPVESLEVPKVQGDENSELGSSLALLRAPGDDVQAFIGAPAQSLAGTGARGAVFQLAPADWESDLTLSFKNSSCPLPDRFCLVGDEDSAGARLGASLVTGFLDRDTSSDPFLLVSAPGYGASGPLQATGAVVLVTDFEGQQTLGDDHSATLYGWNYGEGFGAAVGAADLDGDGVIDIVTSANSGGSDLNPAGGALFAVPTDDTSWGRHEVREPIAVGEGDVQGLGTTLATVEDLTGDGLDGLVASTTCIFDGEAAGCTYQAHVLVNREGLSLDEGMTLTSVAVIEWTDEADGPVTPTSLRVRKSQDTYATLFVGGSAYEGGAGAVWVLPGLNEVATDGGTIQLDDGAHAPILLADADADSDPFEGAQLGGALSRAWWDPSSDDGIAIGAPRWSNSAGAVLWVSGDRLF